MRIYFLGICGTAMGNAALLARANGHEVLGSDQGIYPPMSTVLQDAGIELHEGYDATRLEKLKPDLVVIGNAMSRGNPEVEWLLETRALAFTSLPALLADFVLKGRKNIVVCGTHGKTTTTSLAAYLLRENGRDPGFLIGGVPLDPPVGNHLGTTTDPFVIEGDEYDSAFFDKRSKFVHYSPRTAIFNNLEFDHGDIFPDLAAIQRQFHHLVRTIPGQGVIVFPADDANIRDVLAEGCWSQQQTMTLLADDEEIAPAPDELAWYVRLSNADGSRFELGKFSGGVDRGSAVVDWELGGTHNVRNALAAVAAAHHAGVDIGVACAALSSFKGVKRRQELLGEIAGVRVYDDFAHHPTAIDITLRGMRAKFESAGRAGRLIAVIEPRSNTMKMGIHQATLGQACRAADMTLWLDTGAVELDLPAVVASSPSPARIFPDIDSIIETLAEECREGDDIVIMSNGGFGGIHQKLLHTLRARF